LFRHALGERLGTIIISALIAHTGWHWMMERGELLAQYRWEWPAFDAAFFGMAFRWAFWLVLAGTIAWTAPRFWRKVPKRRGEAG
jgi:hypothetical protein